MKEADWTKPYGKGETSDFSVLLNWDGKLLYDSKLTALDIRFETEGGGFYESKNVLGSAFAGVYRANSNEVFMHSASVKFGRQGNRTIIDGFPSDGAYVVRSRCVEDAERNIISANYSTIRSLFVEGDRDGVAKMWIRYFYNPSPNDCNLEPKRVDRD